MIDGYCSLMGDRLERTDVWQQYHDRVTGEVPVIVVSDAERLDMFEPNAKLLSYGPLDADRDRHARLSNVRTDPMHGDDPTPTTHLPSQLG